MISSRLEKILLSCINWILLSTIFLVPLYFAWFKENYTVFDLNKSSLLSFGIVLILIIWLIIGALNGRLYLVKAKKLYFLLAAFFISVIISTIFSLQPMLSSFGSYERHQGLYNISLYLLAFLFVASFFYHQKSFKNFIITLNISVALACVYGLMQAFGLDFFNWSEISAHRIFSSFGQPNFFGHFLVVIIPLTIYTIAFISQRFLIRLLFIILLLAELACLLFTYSRGAWLALIVALFTALIFYLWHVKKRLLALILVAIVIMSFVALLTPNIRNNIVSNYKTSDNALISRVVNSLNFSSVNSAYSRIRYWQAASKILKQAPLHRQLFGFGPDAETDIFAYHYQLDWAYAEAINSPPDRAHNNFFDILLQFGLFGLATLVSLVIFCLKSLYQVIKKNQADKFWLALAIGTSLIAYLVNNLFSFSLTTMSLLFFVLLALAWRLNNLKDQMSYFVITFFQPISRWLIAVVSIILLLIIFYSQAIRPLIADFYYLQVKKAEVAGDCAITLSNMESVMQWYPESYYYNRIYLHHNSNCLAFVTSAEAKPIIINNILSHFDNPILNKNSFFTLLDSAHAYSALGNYYDPKYYGLAEDRYQKLLAINPNITVVYQDYGKIKIAQKEYELARDLFLDGIAVTPDLKQAVSGSQWTGKIAMQLADFHYLIGTTYGYENNFTQAILEYNQALAINPGLTLAYKQLADIAYQKKDIKAAIRYNKQALAWDRKTSLWPFNLANLYLEIGDKGAAWRYAKLAQRIDPVNEKIQALLEKIAKTK